MKLNIKQLSLLFTWTVDLPCFRINVAWGEMYFIKRGWRLEASLRFTVANSPCFARSWLVPRLSHVYCCFFFILSSLQHICFFLPLCAAFFLFVLAVSVFVETWCFQGDDDVDCILVDGCQYFGETCFHLLGSGFCLGYGGRVILWRASNNLQNTMM
jgi:hypothetical protein